MTWADFAFLAFRGFSVGFAIGTFMWFVRKVVHVFSSFFRPPRLG